MATSKAQRVGIWVIVVFMIVGTIGSFAIIALANKNEASDTARMQKLEAEYKKEYESYQEKLTARDSELSSRYFATFAQFKDLPSEFEASSVSELAKEDLLTGDGADITQESTFYAYYIGWTPDGKVFDGSIDGDSLKSPFEVTPGGVIKGWTQGVDGMKVGGVRLLTIPAELGYGESGSGDSIPPNTPLKFIVMIIETPEVIEAPGIPQELYQYYQKQGAI